ncbi:MAG TPA: hypothetical protein PK052_09040 [Anaerohalosphaeraceae bacterium]|nr:hypothetical protein [Anaerohalosphaeraceae bacterium]HPC65367.1 hypothetical protein [Anaerohalosphaeraceae bacterium]HPO70415.1 hypothetical protein [Anaerohalosphaeraceae bacterium]HRS71774.1 hypothetical protein [Anaerohalosphaeraceae bacterium]HRV20941.1 hypothetical protein [Anaerohalosphaeraceae bacterium]
MDVSRMVWSILWGIGLAAYPCRGGSPFVIQVVDEQTGRGVPMVQLETTSRIRLYTDSGGIAVFDEPGLMHQKVFFFVSSPGYEFPADGFGMRGAVLKTEPAAAELLRIKRLNIAQRLYRITGQGIYRDSVLAGRDVPIRQPLLNSQVCGQDSANNCIYQNKLYWFWGDTARIGYALGHFATAGATSIIAGPNADDPDKGINLNYFIDNDGFSKKMFPLPQPGMVWIDGVMTARTAGGGQRMLCRFGLHKDLAEITLHGLGVFNDQTVCFEPILQEAQSPFPYSTSGHAAAVETDAGFWWYCTIQFPASIRLRLRPEWEAAINPDSYEVFTALGQEAGLPSRWIAFGQLAGRFASRQAAQEALEKEHQSLRLYDIESGKPVVPHGGHVCWNPCRNKWILICNQAGGDHSYLGEVWYAEADTPVGPWGYARKIITHDRYSFYNPKQHPYFAKGSMIYFEGTYSFTFSADDRAATPRYDYNQIMYGLDLTDERLLLPEAVYQLDDGSGHAAYLFAQQVRQAGRTHQVVRVAFYAYPPSRRPPAAAAVYAVQEKGAAQWSTSASSGGNILFYAPADNPAAMQSNPMAVGLYRYVRTDSGQAVFSTDTDLKDAGFVRDAQPVCWVYAAPSDGGGYDWQARAQRPLGLPNE